MVIDAQEKTGIKCVFHILTNEGKRNILKHFAVIVQNVS